MKKYSQAYSILELMVVVGIIGVLAAASVRLTTEFTTSTGLTTTNNDLVAALQYARSTSIRLQDRVVVCTSSNADTPTPTCGGATVPWHDGWIIFHDADNSADYDVTSTDTLLAVHEKTAIKGLSIELVQQSNLVNYVSYTAPAGEPQDVAASSQSGIFKICMANEPDEIRGVRLNVSGRVSSTRDLVIIGSACP